MAHMRPDWTEELERWLEPFLACLGNKTRRRMCPLYVAGLIGPGDRKSVQPMATRLAPGDYDQLHHFIAAGVWDATPLEAELLAEADRLVGGDGAVLVIDDTALPKKGSHSVGVAPQYASALGKNANCQTLVSTTLASGEVPVMIGLRLFLPESWTNDPVRLRKARVPDDRQAFRSKPEIAIEEIDRIKDAGVRFGCVLADAGYGLSAPFRQALSARGLRWAVGIPFKQKVYPILFVASTLLMRSERRARLPCALFHRLVRTCWASAGGWRDRATAGAIAPCVTARRAGTSGRCRRTTWPAGTRRRRRCARAWRSR